jgi:hypothetical protein
LVVGFWVLGFVFCFFAFLFEFWVLVGCRFCVSDLDFWLLVLGPGFLFCVLCFVLRVLSFGIWVLCFVFWVLGFGV